MEADIGNKNRQEMIASEGPADPGLPAENASNIHAAAPAFVDPQEASSNAMTNFQAKKEAERIAEERKQFEID